jgi:hypothetical protein
VRRAGFRQPHPGAYYRGDFFQYGVFSRYTRENTPR